MLVFISAILSSMENQHENETWNVLSYWLVGSIIPSPISYHGDCTVYYGKSCPSHGESITKGNQFNNVETIIAVLQISALRSPQDVDILDPVPDVRDVPSQAGL